MHAVAWGHPSRCSEISLKICKLSVVLWKKKSIDYQGKMVLVLVPMASLFALHALDPDARLIWNNLCMNGYFELEAMGTNLHRSWEAFFTLQLDNTCRVNNFDEEPQEIMLDQSLVCRVLWWHDSESCNTMRRLIGMGIMNFIEAPRHPHGMIWYTKRSHWLYILTCNISM